MRVIEADVLLSILDDRIKEPEHWRLEDDKQ